MQQILDALVNGLVMVVVAVIGYVGLEVRKLVVQKISELVSKQEKNNVLMAQNLAVIAVQAVEQMFKEIKGEAKLKEAIGILKVSLDNHGLKLSDAQMETLVESAVHEMNEFKVSVTDAITKPLGE